MAIETNLRRLGIFPLILCPTGLIIGFLISPFIATDMVVYLLKTIVIFLMPMVGITLSGYWLISILIKERVKIDLLFLGLANIIPVLVVFTFYFIGAPRIAP